MRLGPARERARLRRVGRLRRDPDERRRRVVRSRAPGSSSPRRCGASWPGVLLRGGSCRASLFAAAFFGRPSSGPPSSRAPLLRSLLWLGRALEAGVSSVAVDERRDDRVGVAVDPHAPPDLGDRPVRGDEERRAEGALDAAFRTSASCPRRRRPVGLEIGIARARES